MGKIALAARSSRSCWQAIYTVQSVDYFALLDGCVEFLDLLIN